MKEVNMFAFKDANKEEMVDSIVISVLIDDLKNVLDDNWSVHPEDIEYNEQIIKALKLVIKHHTTPPEQKMIEDHFELSLD